MNPLTKSLLVSLCWATGCASTSTVQLAATSKSSFDGAVVPGQTIALEQPTPQAEQYRIFQQGATGFVSLSSVRGGVEDIASKFCDRKGQVFRGITETTSVPPHVLGNFPRVELVFECVDRPSVGKVAVPASSKYDRLATLKKLLDDGTLTQQEFEVEKAKVLSEP